MFEYFPTKYPWSMATLMTLNAGAVMSEFNEACRDLKLFPEVEIPGLLPLIDDRRERGTHEH